MWWFVWPRTSRGAERREEVTPSSADDDVDVNMSANVGRCQGDSAASSGDVVDDEGGWLKEWWTRCGDDD